MACQLLDNLFAWALKNESKQPTVNLGLATYTYKAPPKPPILQPGRPPMPPGMPIPVLDGSGSGELFYTPAHIEKFNKFMLSIPASFGGEIKYETALSRGPIQNVSVQITA